VSEKVNCRPEELPGLIRSHLNGLQTRIGRAVQKTAADAVTPIRKRAPKAFGDLQNSVHAVPGPNPKTIVDAPHAGAVERGSPPHTPDFERLLAWVKLRGMQGLNGTSRRDGRTTARQATRVKDLLSHEVQRGPGGPFSPVDSPTRVAEAIAKGIEKHGTRPYWFVRESLEDVRALLNTNVRGALKK
jgi:hypothetical protein